MSQKCYICGSSDTDSKHLKVSEEQSLDILVCNSCQHASRISPLGPEDNLKKQKDRFDKIVRKPKLKLPWYHTQVLLTKKISRMAYRGKGSKALDIGCNNGQFLFTLDGRWNKYGVEVSDVAANIAKQFTNANIFCGPVELYQADPESFDVITAFALIEHLTDPRKLIQWIYSHLKKGGFLVLMTGDRESKMAKHFGQTWPMYLPPEHLHFFSDHSLSTLLSEEGFSVKYRQWRSAKYGRKSMTATCIAKAKEILELIKKPEPDHLYLYAQKPE
jgi:SAM-dependent methyltransferase